MRLESKRASVPTLYLELGNKIATLLASPELEAKWHDPSALEGMSVGADPTSPPYITLIGDISSGVRNIVV